MRLPLPFSLGKLLGPLLTLGGVLAVVYLALTGRFDLEKLADGVGSLVERDKAAATAQPPETLPAVAPGETITIATFNIQQFGRSKAGKPDVMAYLARICASFDLIAIQEAMSPDVDPVGQLVRRINDSYGNERGRYRMLISDPIGRTTHREQYAFVFNTSRVRPLPQRAYVMDDSQEDRIHREPLVATFQTVVPADATQMPFTFTIVNAHTDPDEVGSDPMGENELNVLADIYEIVRSYETQLAGEDDFLLVGDLNAPRGQLMRLGTVPGLESVAPPGPTMVRETGEYDHILVDTTTTTEFTGTAAVVSLQEAFELSREQALTISDHRPVYAEFSAFEAPRRSPAVAGDARTLRR